MKIQKFHFGLHDRFRNGIFVLALLILLIILFFKFYPKPEKQSNFVENKMLQSKIDSLIAVAETEKRTYTISPFNPNFISDYKAYQLGITAEELNRIRDYKEKGLWMNSVEDFQKVSGITGKRLNELKTYFKFPEWTKQKKKFNYKNKPVELPIAKKKDLNEINASDLIADFNIPDFIAERIVNYRTKIGGFVNDIQLKDINGLYDGQRTKILASCTVKNKPEITKLNINKASVKQLVTLPYLDFETWLEVRDFIKANGPINDFEELGKIEGFPLEKIDRIALYLTLK